MFVVKNFISTMVEKLTGRKCSRCKHNCGGICCHPSDSMFTRCWHGITRPGFKKRG